MTNPNIKQTIPAFFSRYPMVGYKKGEIILSPDDPIRWVYYIESGYIRLYNIIESGKELTLSIFKPGSYFPMFLVLGNAPNTYYFESFTPTKLYKAPKEDVIQVMQKEPDVLFEFTSRVSIGLNGLLENMQFLLFGPVHNRVASTLLLFSKRFGEETNDGQRRIILPLTHQDIANSIGVARETASLEMEQLVRKNLISYTHKTITIKNVALLEKEAHMVENTEISDSSF